MSDPERSLEPAAELLRRASRLDEAADRRARARFLLRVDEERARGGAGKRLALGLAPLAVALLAAVLWFTRAAPTLHYVVEGAPHQDGYVRVPEDRLAVVTFSDRTAVRAAAGARLRIDEIDDDHGARVSVERGRIEAEVTHTGHGNWRFAAGPFMVRVTGTRFDLNWDPERERLEVNLHEGSVEVRGYAGSGTVSVRAGQRFVGDAREKTLLVREGLVATSEAPAAAVPSSEPDEPIAKDTPAPSSPGSGAAPAPGKTSWSELVAKGEFRRVVDEAGDRGMSNCLATCSANDLAALADAARYVQRADWAEQALLALRGRFAAHSGSRAAFLLGRLEEGRGGSSAAKKWYETVLREAPGGAFASEALAGKMRIVSKLEGPRAARAVAEEYLRLYPKGVHARAARQLIAQP